MKKSIPLPLRSGAFLLVLVFSSLIQAGEVSIRKIDLPAQGGEENPQSFVRIVIDGQNYNSGWIGDDWSYLSNTYGYDLVVTPPSSHSGFLGVKVEPFVDEKKNPIPAYTKDLFEAELKKLKPEETLSEGEVLPLFQEGMTSFVVGFRKIEGVQTIQYQYSVRLFEGEKWIFVCQATPSQFPALTQNFQYLQATFSKVASLVQAANE